MRDDGADQVERETGVGPFLETGRAADEERGDEIRELRGEEFQRLVEG